MIPLRPVGHVLLWCGFLAGTYLCVQRVEIADAPWRTIDWPLYGMALLVGCVGVVILRWTRRREATHSHKLEANIQVLEASLRHLRPQLAEWMKRRDQIEVHAVHGMIDSELMEHVDRFVTAREAVIYTFGLQSYAQLMTDFSIAERNLNRAWCASADGYVDEVWLSLDRADLKLQAVAEHLAECQKRRLPG
jgi:hypothetical protein